MGCIGIVQMARGKIEHTNEECDEHTRLIIVAQGIVDGNDNPVGCLSVSRYITEQRTGNSHYQRRRNTLARHIAYAEDKLVVADIEVVQVATDSLCGCHLSVNVHVVALRECRVCLRQHRHLDVVGNLQLTLNRGFGGSGTLQLLNIIRQ